MFIARQPIFNKAMKIYGYELLFRATEDPKVFSNSSSSSATAVVMGGLFEQGIDKIVGKNKAFVNFDYDFIMYDTYDYIDKLIGFKLSDIFYAALVKYHEKLEDERALKLAKYIKYGTDNERHIWLLRYGLSFEDIEVLDKHIANVSSEEIVFKDTIIEVSENEKRSVIRFLNK